MDKENTKFKKFLIENRSLLITIPVFLVLIGVVIYMYVFAGGNDQVDDPTPAQPPVTDGDNDNDAVEVTPLPIYQREKDSSEIEYNPFSDPYRVSGIIYTGNDQSVAVIEAEDKSFILKKDQKAENLFTVLQIEKDNVTIEVEGSPVVLWLEE